jgi:hypothetical protein
MVNRMAGNINVSVSQKGQSHALPLSVAPDWTREHMPRICLLMLGRTYYSAMLLPFTDLVEGVALYHGRPWATLRSKGAL